MSLIIIFPGVLVCRWQRLQDGNIDRLLQERHNSIAIAMELCRSCTNPSIWSAKNDTNISVLDSVHDFIVTQRHSETPSEGDRNYNTTICTLAAHFKSCVLGTKLNKVGLYTRKEFASQITHKEVSMKKVTPSWKHFSKNNTTPSLIHLIFPFCSWPSVHHIVYWIFWAS